MKQGRRGEYFVTRILAIILVILFLSVLSSPSTQTKLPQKPFPASFHNPNIESALEEIAMAYRDYGLSACSKVAQRKGLPMHGERVKVILETKKAISRVDIGLLQTLGARIETQSFGLLEAFIPVNKLEEVAKLESISFIRRPYKPVGLGTPSLLTDQPAEETSTLKNSERYQETLISQAVTLTGGTLFHSRNFQGAGVKVAVIDVGFASFKYAQNSGEFPAGVIAETKDYTGEGFQEGTPHGTAVAEIVHDMAPQAKLFLKKVANEVELGRAVEDCINQDVDIIVHSVGWLNTNFGDGEGVVARIAERARSQGILWVNAAGNHAQRHWEGTAKDFDNDGWVEFEGGQETLEVELDLPGNIGIFLTWNDWPETNQDYDLFLFDNNNQRVAASQAHQTGTEPPTEEIRYNALDPGTYKVKVFTHRVSEEKKLEIYSLNHRLKPNVSRSSILAPGNAEGVFTIGAVNYRDWPAGPQESYSSQGPTADGRIKPDLAGPDGVVSFVYQSFLGTSSSAPHVAGAAALLFSKCPNASIEKITRILEEDATDLGRLGKDNIYGWGTYDLNLGYVHATRSIKTNISGHKVVQGGKFLVSIEVSMPYNLRGGINLEEKLPPGFKTAPIQNDGAQFDKKRVIWTWPILNPEESKVITYQVSVPETQKLGNYKIKGLVNQNSTDGESEIEVVEPLAPKQAITRWDGEKINMTSNGFINHNQINQALKWWQEDLKVPGLARIIQFEEMQKLVAYYLTHIPTEDSLSEKDTCSLFNEELVNAIRDIRIRPNSSDSFEVRIDIKALTELNGLGLKENFPSEVQVTLLEKNGAEFKKAGDSAYWIWPETFHKGDSKVVRYKVSFQEKIESDTYPKVIGAISSSCPQTNMLVKGDSVFTPNQQVNSSKKKPTDLEGTFDIKISTLMDGGLKLDAGNLSIEGIRVRIFDLSGKMVFDSGWKAESTFEWHLQKDNGEVVANGVYLCVVQVETSEEEIIKGKVEKILVLR